MALIQSGSCLYEQKVANAREAGYAAVIIFNEGQEDRQELLFATLLTPTTIPVLGTTFALGRELVDLARGGRDVRVNLTTRATSEIFQTENVLADTADGDPDRVVLVGGHLDSAPEGPGINDNGSGTSVILETALQAARLKLRLRNKVRFAFWGAEEEGLVGSAYYVSRLSAAQRRTIDLNLNFDMLGSPNFVRFVYDGDGSLTPDDPNDAGPAGSDVIEDVFVAYFRSLGLKTEPRAFTGRSDYGPFIEVGIPAGGLFSGAGGIKTRQQARVYGGKARTAYDPCYHEECDDIDNLSRTALDQLGDAAAHAVAVFADRGEPLGRQAKGETMAEGAAPTARGVLPYRGPRLQR